VKTSECETHGNSAEVILH